jgi:hypothetical protein
MQIDLDALRAASQPTLDLDALRDAGKNRPSPFPVPKPEPLPGGELASEIWKETTGPVRRLKTLLKSKAAQTAPVGGLGVGVPAGSVPPPVEITPEELSAGKGLALDVGLTAATSGLAKIGLPLAAPILSRVAPKAAPFALKALRSAATFAGLESWQPSEEEQADAAARVKSIGESAGMGLAFAGVAKLVAPLGRAINAILPSILPSAEKGIVESASKRFEQAFTRRFAALKPEQILNVELPKVSKAAQTIAEDLKTSIRPSAAAEVVGQSVESIAETGTLAPGLKPAAREVARKITSPATLIGEKKMRGLQYAIASLSGALSAARQRIEDTGSTETAKVVDVYQSMLNRASEEFLRGRRAFARVGHVLQTPIAEEGVNRFIADLKRVGQGIADLPPLETAKTGAQRLVEAVKTGDLGKAAGILTSEYWRRNIFPLASFIADTIGNASKTGQHAAESAALDVFDYITLGRPGQRVAGLVNAIAASGEERQAAKSLFAPTALGIRFGDFFGKELDKYMFPGAALKTGVDSMFKRLGALSSLYSDALTEARQRGLSGVERTGFIRDFVLKPPGDSMQKAIELGQKLGFTESIPRVVRATGANPVVQLFVSPFLNFQYRFLRWMAEFTPFSPDLLGKLRTGKATASDLLTYATRNATGLGAVYLTDQTLYDNIDFKMFEYVTPENGRRTSLNNLSPLPEVFALNALLRREPDKAYAAVKNSSVNFFLVGGLLSTFQQALQQVRPGGQFSDVTTRALERTLQGLIPGQAVLRTLKDVIDPISREGLLGQMPGISFSQPARISPTTGEPVKIQRQIIGTDIPAPAALGQRGTEREPDPIEKEIRRLNMTGFNIQLRAPAVRVRLETKAQQEETQRAFEQARGRHIYAILGPIIARDDYRQLTEPDKAALIRRAFGIASKMAGVEAQNE